MNVGTLAGRLEALHSGVTTMLDWHHVAQTHDHEDAAIAALRAAPGRSVFCLGAGWGHPDPVDTEIRRVRDALPGSGSVAMAWGLRGADATGMDLLARELEIAAELGLRTSLHVDAGGAGRPVAELRERGLLRDTTTLVHANGLSDDQLRMLADAGCSLGLVDTVLVAGRAVKRRGVLVDVDLPALRDRLLDSRDRIAAAAVVPPRGTWRPQPA